MIVDPAAAGQRAIAKLLVEVVLPRPMADPFTLYQLVVADLIVLVMACGVPLLISPAWGLPQTYVPVYAVLVTLFGFTEGLYKDNEEPRLARLVGILARSAVFAIALVCIAARGTLLPLALPATLWNRVDAGAATVSTRVFQVPQCGHWPCHFGLWPPHSVQL